MDYIYASIALAIFISYTIIMLSVFRALRPDFIDKKAIWFMISYAVLFSLKAMVYSVTLI